jgi:ankyrin repeat protein
MDDLRKALGEGDPDRIRALIEAGANIRYKCDHGYDALLDAVHHRDIPRDPRLLDLLALLIAHGVDLSGVSSYRESGLRVLSRLGRFDAVRLLLEAGADRTHLEWNPLMEAVALGSLADVRAMLEGAPPLEERDWWERTAWLIALLTGDIAKAKLLREHGADTTVCGRCGCPPLFYAIMGHHHRMLQWLLEIGVDVHQTDEFGTTALIEAAGEDDLECVEILLHAGADVHVNANGTAIRRTRSRAIIMRLLDAGADPADACQWTILGLKTDDDPLAAVSLDDFRRAYTRIFGDSNPERMPFRFWEAMIRCGGCAYTARQWFENKEAPITEPVWCVQRYGQSLTLLPDGRAIQIGGEHEDWYDPDFCIYNDVFVFDADRSVTVYGYPESVFPPTDFHTATLVGDFIYIIGSLGYMGTRRCGETPVYRLNVHTLQMERVQVEGDGPGWIHQHRAIVARPGQIRVWAGKVIKEEGDKEVCDENLATFVLDLDLLQWHREVRQDR